MIYAIQARKGEPVKFGYSKDRASLKRRLRTLQNAQPYKLKVLATCEGNRVFEFHIHKWLERSRVRGEWFEYNEDTQTMIDLVKRFKGKTMLDMFRALPPRQRETVGAD